jgi:hypothetical protein
MKTSPRILLHLLCTTLIIGISGCGSLHAATSVDLSPSAWEYESNSPAEGNLVEKTPDPPQALLLNYRIAPPPAERFSMYRCVDTSSITLDSVPATVKAEILGDGSGVGIVLHFVDRRGTNHLYHLVKSVQWSDWTEIEEPWEVLGHNAWGPLVPADSPDAGADAPVEFPIVLKGITIQAPGGSETGAGKIGIRKLSFQEK